MRHESIDGIVVRVRDYGEHDRYLSILTAERGRMTLLSKGSRSLKGPQTSVSQLYAYANFEYYSRGDFNVLKGGSVNDHFYGLCMDLDRMDLAAYFCDLICEVTDEGEEAGELLRLLLNALYAVSRDLRPQQILKGAFEMRTAALSGYAPDLSGCTRCGAAQSEHFYLNVMNGALLCADCFTRMGNTPVRRARGDYDDIREAELICPVSAAVLAALRYCTEAPQERIFSFDLPDGEDLRSFASVAETYILSHLGRGFESLQFYHTMRQSPHITPLKEST